MTPDFQPSTCRRLVVKSAGIGLAVGGKKSFFLRHYVKAVQLLTAE